MQMDLPESFDKTCFRAMWSNCRDAMFVLSVDGDDFCYQKMNSQYEKLLGITEKDIFGIPLSDFYHPAIYELISTPFKQCVVSHLEFRYEQMLELTKDNYSEWETILSPVIDSRGRVAYLLGQCRDIGQEKQLQRHIAELENELNNAKKIKASFLANISHEMRTPINGILGAVDIVLNGKDDAEKRHFADILSASSSDLIQLTDDILDFARLKNASLNLAHERFSLYEIIKDIELQKQSVLIKNGDSLQCCIEDIKQSYFYGDASRVRQMISILVDNAVKFTENGVINICVNVVSEGSDYQWLDINIRDTGCGMASKDLDQAFVPFKQLDQSSSRKQGGLGLGLSICQQLSILMSGDMRVISELGLGSEFTLHLPLTVDVDNANNIHKRNDRSLLNGAKVLLVDDNPVNLIVAEKLLFNNGLDVVSVSNGRQALKYFQNHRVDIVIMDWHMPEMDGVEATEKIRQLDTEKANIPIIGLTANAQHDSQVLYDLSDMNDVLTKPINPELLMDKLVHWLNVPS